MPRIAGPGPENGEPGRQGNPFAGPAPDEREPLWADRTTRRTQVALMVFGVLMLVFTVVVLAVKGNPKEKLRERASARPPAKAAPAAPSSTPPAVVPGTATVERPWAGSPAEAWPAGADALVLPQATAVGVFGPEQVARNLELAKSYLVATNLDPKVLAGGYPQAAIDLVDRETGDRLAADLAHPSEERDPSDRVSRFDPAWAVPVTDQVKAQGLITFEGDGEQGLLVHADVTFVYALKPGPQVGKASPSASPSAPGPRPTGGSGGGGGPKSVAWIQDEPGQDEPGQVEPGQVEPGQVEVEREIVRRRIDFRFADPARFQVKQDRVSVLSSSTERANTLCGFTGGYLRPSFRADRGDGSAAPSGGPTADPYDWHRPLNEKGNCGPTSRS